MDKIGKGSAWAGNDICKLKIKETIDRVDKTFASRLYKYRSRLLHDKRDRHDFNLCVVVPFETLRVKILSSDSALKLFKGICEDYGGYENYTLNILSYWLIVTTLKKIDEILSALVVEIKNNSSYHKNLVTPKSTKSLVILSYDSNTHLATPQSEIMWYDYKSRYNELSAK